MSSPSLSAAEPSAVVAASVDADGTDHHHDGRRSDEEQQQQVSSSGADTSSRDTPPTGAPPPQSMDMLIPSPPPPPPQSLHSAAAAAAASQSSDEMTAVAPNASVLLHTEAAETIRSPLSDSETAATIISELFRSAENNGPSALLPPPDHFLRSYSHRSHTRWPTYYEDKQQQWAQRPLATARPPIMGPKKSKDSPNANAAAADFLSPSRTSSTATESPVREAPALDESALQANENAVVAPHDLASSAGPSPTLNEAEDEDFLLLPENLTLCITVYPYTADKNDELSFVEGLVIRVVRKVQGGWWEGQLDQRVGWFPANHTIPFHPAKTQGVGDNDEVSFGPFVNTIAELDQLRLQTILLNNEIQAQDRDASSLSGLKVPKEKNEKSHAYDTNQTSTLTEVANRSNVLSRLLAAEKEYAASLTAFIEEFVRPITKEQWLSIHDRFCMFANIGDLLDLHKGLIDGLEVAVAEPKGIRIVSRCFMDFCDRFIDTYVQYSSLLPDAISTASKYSQDSDMNRFLMTTCAKSTPPILHLVSFLHKPMQRKHKYHIFLKEMLSCTSPNDPDYNDLLAAYDNMIDAVGEIEAARRMIENREVVRNIMRRLDSWDGPGLEHYGDLVLEGNLKLHEGGRPRERQFYLLEKILVVLWADRSSNGNLRFRMIDRVFISRMIVKNVSILKDSEESPLSFQLTHLTDDGKLKTMTVTAFNPDQLIRWTSMIERQLDRNKRTTFPSLPREVQDEILSIHSGSSPNFSGRARVASPSNSKGGKTMKWLSRWGSRIKLKLNNSNRDDAVSPSGSEKDLIRFRDSMTDGKSNTFGRNFRRRGRLDESRPLGIDTQQSPLQSPPFNVIHTPGSSSGSGGHLPSDGSQREPPTRTTSLRAALSDVDGTSLPPIGSPSLPPGPPGTLPPLIYPSAPSMYSPIPRSSATKAAHHPNLNDDTDEVVSHLSMSGSEILSMNDQSCHSMHSTGFFSKVCSSPKVSQLTADLGQQSEGPATAAAKFHSSRHESSQTNDSSIITLSYSASTPITMQSESDPDENAPRTSGGGARVTFNGINLPRKTSSPSGSVNSVDTVKHVPAIIDVVNASASQGAAENEHRVNSIQNHLRSPRGPNIEAAVVDTCSSTALQSSLAPLILKLDDIGDFGDLEKFGIADDICQQKTLPDAAASTADSTTTRVSISSVRPGAGHAATEADLICSITQWVNTVTPTPGLFLSAGAQNKRITSGEKRDVLVGRTDHCLDRVYTQRPPRSHSMPPLSATVSPSGERIEKYDNSGFLNSGHAKAREADPFSSSHRMNAQQSVRRASDQNASGVIKSSQVVKSNIAVVGGDAVGLKDSIAAARALMMSKSGTSELVSDVLRPLDGGEDFWSSTSLFPKWDFGVTAVRKAPSDRSMVNNNLDWSVCGSNNEGSYLFDDDDDEVGRGTSCDNTKDDEDYVDDRGLDDDDDFCDADGYGDDEGSAVESRLGRSPGPRSRMARRRPSLVDTVSGAVMNLFKHPHRRRKPGTTDDSDAESSLAGTTTGSALEGCDMNGNEADNQRTYRRSSGREGSIGRIGGMVGAASGASSIERGYRKKASMSDLRDFFKPHRSRTNSQTGVISASAYPYDSATEGSDAGRSGGRGLASPSARATASCNDDSNAVGGSTRSGAGPNCSNPGAMGGGGVIGVLRFSGDRDMSVSSASGLPSYPLSTTMSTLGRNDGHSTMASSKSPSEPSIVPPSSNGWTDASGSSLNRQSSMSNENTVADANVVYEGQDGASRAPFKALPISLSPSRNEMTSAPSQRPPYTLLASGRVQRAAAPMSATLALQDGLPRGDALEKAWVDEVNAKFEMMSSEISDLKLRVKELESRSF